MICGIRIRGVVSPQVVLFPILPAFDYLVHKIRKRGRGMVSDIYNSVYDYFKEKLVSPVSGVFLFIWAIFNWKAVFIIFLDSRPIIERIEFVTENHADAWQVFWRPAVFTVLYVVVYPLVVLGSFTVAEYVDVWKRKLRFYLEEGRPKGSGREQLMRAATAPVFIARMRQGSFLCASVYFPACR